MSKETKRNETQRETNCRAKCIRVLFFFSACTRVIIIIPNDSCLLLFAVLYNVQVSPSSCLFTQNISQCATPCDIKTIKNNSVNSPSSVFKCSLISEARINLKSRIVQQFVCLSSLKCVVFLHVLAFVNTAIIAKNQLPNTKSIFRDCKRAHLKIKLFSDNWIDDISLMQIFPRSPSLYYGLFKSRISLKRFTTLLEWDCCFY